MIVVDSAALVDLLVGNEPSATFVRTQLERADTLVAPCLVDVEVVGALRRLEAAGAIGSTTAAPALDGLRDLDLDRYPLPDLVERVWSLRHHLAPGDAFFVTLAEALDAPLVTTDRRLSRAHGHEAVVVAP